MGHHRFYGKMAPYDSSVRVPLYAFGPGFAAGSVDSRLVATSILPPHWWRLPERRAGHGRTVAAVQR
jgi:hypothetical protein